MTTRWSEADAQASVIARIQKLGYQDVLEYLKCEPGKWYDSLAQELGSNVIGRQLISIVSKEARAKHQLRWAAMDYLVRRIRHIFQNGWGKVYRTPNNPLMTKEEEAQAEIEIAKQPDERVRFQKTGAFIGFATDLDDAFSTPRLHDLGDAIGKVFDELHPPVGWLPTSPDDPIIQEAFSRVWPPGREKNFTPERAAERLKEKGYSSLLDYLDDHPAQPYEELVKEIGPDPIAVDFLRWLHLREAERAGAVRRAALDCLAREIAQAGGWPGVSAFGSEGSDPKKMFDAEKKELEWKATLIQDRWMLALLSFANPEVFEPTWKALEKSNPARGWLPSGPDDPLLVAAFEKGWPRRRS